MQMFGIREMNDHQVIVICRLYLQENLRKPIYEKKHIQIAIFMPTVPELPESDDEIPMCYAYELLPV